MHSTELTSIFVDDWTEVFLILKSVSESIDLETSALSIYAICQFHW